jgi:uncharacterized membrane protein
MRGTAAITIFRPQEDVERLWRDSPRLAQRDAVVRFSEAPGGRGTEIHVELERGVPGPVTGAVKKALGSDPVAKAKDELRRFKQLAETGEVARSDAAPEGELLERKPRQRPAQPLAEAERQKVGV